MQETQDMQGKQSDESKIKEAEEANYFGLILNAITNFFEGFVAFLGGMKDRLLFSETLLAKEIDLAPQYPLLSTSEPTPEVLSRIEGVRLQVTQLISAEVGTLEQRQRVERGLKELQIDLRREIGVLDLPDTEVEGGEMLSALLMVELDHIRAYQQNLKQELVKSRETLKTISAPTIPKAISEAKNDSTRQVGHDEIFGAVMLKLCEYGWDDLSEDASKDTAHYIIKASCPANLANLGEAKVADVVNCIAELVGKAMYSKGILYPTGEKGIYLESSNASFFRFIGGESGRIVLSEALLKKAVQGVLSAPPPDDREGSYHSSGPSPS